MVWSLVTGAASLAGTIMAPILEKWEQAGIRELGASCQNAVKSTCWHAGRIVTYSGMAVPFVLAASPALSALTGVALGRLFPCTGNPNEQISDDEFCCKIKAYSIGMGAAVLIFGASLALTVIVIRNYAEPAVYAIGSNSSLHDSLEAAIEGYNALGTVSWVATNVTTFAFGVLFGRVTSPCAKRAREVPDQEGEPLM